MNSLVTVKQLNIVSQQKSVLSSAVLNSFYSYLDVSKATLTAYRTGIRQFIKFIQLNGEEIPNRDTVLKFKRTLLDSGKKSSTVSLYISAIRRFFDWCETEGLYSNIARGVKSPKQARGHRRDALSASQLKACISGLSGNSEQAKRDRAVFLLMSTCGLRCCEVTRADIGDIHEVQGVACLAIMGKGRDSKDAFVKLSEPVLAAIREYISVRGQVSENEPLFASCSKRNKGQRLTTRTVSSICKQAMHNVGIDSRRLTAHSLRHSAATLALQAGAPLQEVSEFLRHSNIGVTMIYVHSIARLQSKCEASVTAAILAA